MTNRDSGGWLEAVLLNAWDAGWCTLPNCTTCGCGEFRRAYWSAAAREAGIGNRFNSPHIPQSILADLSRTEGAAITRALIAGLRLLPPQWCDSEAFRLIVIDFNSSLLLQDAPLALDTELSGTPAGDGLAQMRAHARRVEAERDHRVAYESPQAVEERKRFKREKKAPELALRQAQTQKRNYERLELLAALARLSVTERLSRFAVDPTLNLNWVSAELIPAQESDLVELEAEDAIALVTRIGRRKGAWGRLRRMISSQLEPEP